MIFPYYVRFFKKTRRTNKCYTKKIKKMKFHLERVSTPSDWSIVQKRDEVCKDEL